jgi:hypothetical protein
MGLADCAGHQAHHERGLSYLETAANIESHLAAYGYPHRDASNRLRRARAERRADCVA